MSMSTTRYTLVWGFYTNESMLVRERFEGAEGRKAAMARVLEIMSKRCTPYVGSPERKLPALLQVYATAPDGTSSRANFQPHGAGSRFIKWTDAHGQGWAVHTSIGGVTIG